MSEHFEDLSGINLSELDKTAIVDSEGENIGRLIDAVLVKGEKGMEISKFVVGDSKIVELLERLNLRPDIDPVFPLSSIKKVSRSKITLTVPKSELKATHVDDDVLAEGEYKLTELSRTPVFDKSGDKIGRVIDLTFDQDNFQLILGDSIVTEWAESIGLQEDIDFLIAPNVIDEFTKEKITLKKNKSELEETFMKNLDAYKNQMDTTKEMTNKKTRYYFPTYM